MAYIDKDGFAFIVDRKKDMINVGGEKVFPAEVESVIESIPGVEEATDAVEQAEVIITAAQGLIDQLGLF